MGGLRERETSHRAGRRHIVKAAVQIANRHLPRRGGIPQLPLAVHLASGDGGIRRRRQADQWIQARVADDFGVQGNGLQTAARQRIDYGVTVVGGVRRRLAGSGGRASIRETGNGAEGGQQRARRLTVIAADRGAVNLVASGVGDRAPVERHLAVGEVRDRDAHFHAGRGFGVGRQDGADLVIVSGADGQSGAGGSVGRYVRWFRRVCALDNQTVFAGRRTGDGSVNAPVLFNDERVPIGGRARQVLESRES